MTFSTLPFLLTLFVGMCPTGWINAVGTNDCYLFARDGPGVTWMQAKDYCISVGGKLAEITDQRSQDFVRRYGDPNIFWWLGGYKASNVSVFSLQSGQSISYKYVNHFLIEFVSSK